MFRSPEQRDGMAGHPSSDKTSVSWWLRRPGEERKDEWLRRRERPGGEATVGRWCSPASRGLIGTTPRVHPGQHGLRTRPKHHATRSNTEECVCERERERERENFTAMGRRHRKLLKTFTEVVQLQEASLLFSHQVTIGATGW